ncbi:neutral amino acid permease [Fusarium sp. NRRL 52700]|nr:neutral amino acid permease [Fusarium sp. NRRL 52700]
MSSDKIAAVEEANNSNAKNEKKISLAASNSNPSSRRNTHVEDEVFGHVGEGEQGPNYRGLSWISTIALMTKTQVGLGVLAIPKTFHTLGLLPGVFCLVAVAGMTSWSSYIVGTFKLCHREVYAIDDAGKEMFGRVGREIFAALLMLNWVFVSASAMLGISVALNVLSDHALCTWAFVIVAAVSTGLLASIRTLGRMGWIAWVGIFGIMSAIFSVTIAVGVENWASPAAEAGNSTKFRLLNDPSFADAMAAVSTHIFAYAGVPGYFPIIAEMREPEHYTSALIWSQSIMTAVYIVVGVIIYCFIGSGVASPALGSAGPKMKKVGYGLALSGLLVSAMIVTHLSAKYIFLRVLRKSDHLHRNSLIHWGTWLGCIGGITIIAYIIASAIPVFDPLVSLIGASFGVFLCFQPFGCMWLYDNWRPRQRSLRWKGKVAWSIFIIIIGTFLMVGGIFGSINGLITATAKGDGRPWSCEDNSNSQPLNSTLS